MPYRVLPSLPLLKLSAVILLLLLQACAAVPRQSGQLPAATGSVQAAQSAEANQQWDVAAAEWLALAGEGSDSAAQYYRSRALSALLSNADVLRARVVFDSIDAKLLRPDEQQVLSVAEAELLLQEGRPGEALVVLPLVLQPPFDSNLEARFLAVRALAFAEQGALIPAIEDFTARAAVLPPGADSQQWQLKLWPLLVTSDAKLLKRGLSRNNRADVAGWLRLGLLGQGEWLYPESFQSELDAWQARHPLHAANAVLLPALREAHSRRQSYPPQIAVMLPLSGRYAAVGEAVRDGLLAAWYSLDRAKVGELQFIDTEQQSPSAWLAAQTDLQATALIGPLRKQQISEVVSSGLSQQLLWLPLNQLPAPELALAESVYALALSPEQEAVLAAERMSREGYHRALVIAAEGDWGQRVVEAFQKRFAETGGKVVGVERYQSSQSDYGETIQRALLLDASERRHRRLNRALARNVEFEPRRRNDVDVVFAPGNPRALRALRPQLKFYRASALPVYATSHAWAGTVNPAADLDLNGVKFPAMPWSIKPAAQDQRLIKQIRRAGGSAKRDRFYALGADALRILPILADRDSHFPWVFPGGSGLLEPGQRGLIKRRLLWAEFRKGKPRLLPAPRLAGAS